MKKLILILLCAVLFLSAAVVQPIPKKVDYTVPDGRVAFVNLYDAEYLDNVRVVLFGDIFDKDSVMLQSNAYWLDNRAPFLVTSEELDSLLAWRK